MAQKEFKPQLKALTEYEHLITDSTSKLRKTIDTIADKVRDGDKTALLEAKTYSDFQSKFDAIKSDITSNTTEQATLLDDLRAEFESMFSTQFTTDEQFFETFQAFASEQQENVTNITRIAQMKQSAQDIEAGNLDITVEVPERELSFDYIQNTYPEFANKISNVFDVSGGQVKEEGTAGDFLSYLPDAADSLTSMEKQLNEDLKTQNKAIEAAREANELAQKNNLLSEAEKDAKKQELDNAVQTYALTQESLNALREIAKSSAERAKRTPGASKDDTRKITGVANKMQANAQKELDDLATGALSKFEMIGKSGEFIGNKMYNAGLAADHMGKAFEGVGDGLQSFGKAKDIFGDVSDVFRNGIFTVAAFGSALAAAGKAIGMYHDQLNISREMGDAGGSLVKDLQNMHINSLIPPEQLKNLSEQISSGFNVSLTQNKKEMERIATKQKLSERMMGKEYSEAQMEAINEMKTVLEGQSPSDMMDSLAAQTSALAQTMGVSNKYALEQIKALHENSKLITKGMNKDIAKKIEEKLQGMAAGMKQAGFSDAYIKEMMEAVSMAAADDDVAAEQKAMAQKVMQMNGEGAKYAKEAYASMGIDQKKALDLMVLRQNVGFEGMTEEQKLQYTEVIKINRQAQQAEYAHWSKIANEQGASTAAGREAIAKMKMMDKEWAKNSEMANAVQTKGVEKVVELQVKGQKEAASRQKGEKTTADLDKLLVAMGATTTEEKNAKLSEVRTNFMAQGSKDEQAAKKEKLQAALVANGDADRAAELQKKKDEETASEDELKELNKIMNDAFKSGFAEEITKSIKEGEKGGTQGILGTKITGDKLKETVNGKDYEKKRIKANSTGVENTKDDLERASTAALYEFQNAVMEATNWIMDNWQTALAVMAGGMLLFAAKGPLGIAIKGLGKGLLAGASGLSSVMGSIGTTMTKGIWAAHKALFKGFGGIAKGVGGFLKDKILGPVGKKMGEMFGPLKEKLGNMFSGFSEKLKGFSFGGSKTISGSGSGGTKVKDDTPFFEKMKKQWGSFKKGLKSGLKGLGSGLKGLGGMVGPMALAGAAMKAFQGAMEGWGKAGEWFGTTTEDLSKQLSFGPMVEKSKEEISKLSDVERKRYYENLANSKKAEKTAKALDPNARWDAEKKAYVDGNGEIIRSSSEKMKIQSDANQKLAESFSKTGTAIWNGSEYVDEYGRKIEASASLSEKSAGAVGGALEALSFGMLDGQHMAHKTKEVFESMGKWFDKIGLTEAFNDLGNTMSDYWNNVLKPIALWIGDVLTPVFGFMGEIFKTVFKYVQGVINVFSGLIDILVGIFTLDAGKIFGGFDSLTDGFGNMLDGFYGLISGAFTAIGGVLDSLGLEWLGGLFKGLGSIVSKVGSYIVKFVSNPLDMMKKGISWLGETFGGVVAVFKWVGGTIIGAVEHLGKMLYKHTVGYFKEMVQGIMGFAWGLVDLVSGIFSGDLGIGDVGQFVKDTFDGIVDFIMKPIRWLADTVGGFFGVDLMTPINSFIIAVKGYFGSIVDGVTGIFGGLYDIIMSPFKRITAFFSGDATLYETITGIWTDVKNGIVNIFSGFIDIITAPFKGIITFIDETFGTDLLGSFTAVKDGILSVFEGFIDLVTAPFKGIVAWLSGEEFSVTGAVSDAFTKALDGIGSVLSGLKEMLISPFKSVVKYLEEKLAKLDPTKWFSDTPEEKEQKEKAKAGDQIHKDLVKQGLITDDYGNDSVSAEQAAKMTAEQIGAILAAHNKSYTGTLESGAIEELKKALQAKADAGDKQAALEIQTLPAKKEGGSTGGPIGDQIAGAFDELRVFAAEPTEIPTATAGENEYVVNAEEGGLLAKAFTKVKGFASKLFGGEKGEVKKGSVGKLPTLSNISTSTSTSTGDASAKIQEKIQTQGIHSLTVDELSEAINLNEELKNEFIDTTPTLESGFSELKKQLAPITKFYKKPIFIDESSITESDSADVLTDGLDTIAKKVGSMSSAMWSWGKNVAKTVVSTVKEKGVIGAAKHGAGKVYETVKSGIGKAADFVKDIAKHLHKSETGKASGDYSAAADIGDGAGISFGAYQLTEKSGGIKDFMKVMAENGDKQALAMMEKFKGNNFTGSDKELTDYLKKVGSTEEGKKAQDDIYSKKYLEPALKLAESKGITDPAAIAQIVDHSVNAGLGGAKRMLGKAEGVSVEDLANARKQDYKDIATKNPKLEKYVKGWTNRVDNNSTTFAKWEGVDLKGRESISASEKAQESKVKDLSKKERKEQTIAQKKISNEQVKKQTKEGIDDKQATQMVTSLKDVVVNLKEQGKSVLFKAKDGLGSVVTKSLGAAGIVGSSISQNVSGVLSGDVSASDALKNVGQTIVGQLPGKITESLKSVIDKLGATGASITTNLQGVLTGETSIGDALKNVGGTMQEQLLGPLQTNLSSAFNSFTGEGGPLDSVFDAFDGDGSISDTFKTITSPEGPLGSALGGIGESITGALGSFDFGGMLGGIGDAVGGLFGGGSSSGGSGGGVMDSVMSAGKSLLGGFFASGGVTKPETINVIGESGPELVGSMEAMAVMNKQQWEQFGQAAGFTQGGGLEFKGPGDKASAGNIPSSAGTSGISTMGSGVKSSSVINNSTKTQTVASTTNTTNNNISGETAGASKDPIAQKLDVLINSVNKLVSHSGQQVKQGDRKFKADVNGQTVQNVKNMQGSKTLS